MNIILFGIILIVYILLMGFLGFLGYRGTKNAEDYLLAGRGSHPYIMAMSYGSTFISTSAIIGFGGVASQYGMGIFWLPFMNILMGIIIAFIIFGKRTRQIGLNLGAQTFPEFLGKRFNSPFIQRFGGLIIFIFMPLYAGVVIIGAARFLETTLNLNYTVALLILAVIIAAYVIVGGLKGVLYTDAAQATIMLVGMIFLIVFAYKELGGFITANQMLTNLADKVPQELLQKGHQGWTAMPKFGSPIWWTLVSTIISGVGIGVLAQPQLAVRFMTVKSNKELNRAVIMGGIFILFMTLVPYTVGSLSNVYFFNNLGKLAAEVVPKGNLDSVIPTFINMAMPKWFVYVFMLTLLSAAMSTISALFHAIGTAFAKDVFRKYDYSSNDRAVDAKLIWYAKIGIIIGIVISVVLGFYLPISIVARGTALFFGICAASFLPVYVFALFWKGSTRAGAISGMVSGITLSLFWMLFVHTAESKPIGLANLIFGKDAIFGAAIGNVDAIFIAFPAAFLITWIVSLASKKMPAELIEKTYRKN